MKRLSLYLDTSVIGGYFDEEFEKPTRQLVEYLKKGIYRASVSEMTLYEINKAPSELIPRLLLLLSEFDFDQIVETEETRQLAKAYLSANVLPQKCWDDARHVAIASVERLDYILSWNFRHLVNVDRIRGFNAVNIQQGYSSIDIRTPLEVIQYGNETL